MTSWRVPLAAAGGVAAALAVLLASAATGGEPEKLIGQARWVPAGLLLAQLVATVTATVAVTARAAARRGGLAAVLGPIVAALIVGGKQAILVTQVRDGAHESSYLNGVHHIGTSAGLLLIAALMAAGIVVAEALRSRIRPAHAPA